MTPAALNAKRTLTLVEAPEFLLVAGVELGVEEVDVWTGIEELNVTPCAV